MQENKTSWEELEKLKCINGAMYFGSNENPCDCGDVACINQATYEDNLAELKNFISNLITLQRAEERELVKREIIIYQNRFVIAHDRGPDAAPEIEFEPEYDVIEKLLNSLK